ncbi:MAG: Aspartate--ammonia ligase [Candidatus Woesearchaeota archaeon]|nr:Aspartate--ammonia ligase [Candidatus Woesearchaeota archaeon]
MKQTIKKEYEPKLDFFETEKGIKLIKDTFEGKLAEKLNLLRVSAPRFLKIGKGLQDDLAGTQIPVRFKSKFTEDDIEIVHSLAKWKRWVLGKYGFDLGTGLYTDMDAVRKDEDVSAIHSIYVDQWDWELVISKEQRILKFLKKIIRDIYSSLLETEETVVKEYPQLKPILPKEIKFIHSEDLEEKYPDLTPKQREHEITKEYGAVFLVGIGHPLKSGEPHDARAADYDDWSTGTIEGKKGLNGDILVWDPVREDALELTSMGIRVDAKAMQKQLEHQGLSHKKSLEFHKGVIKGELPLTMGGGIGQSRMCMLLLQKAHIAEVQSSVWPEAMETEFAERGIPML